MPNEGTEMDDAIARLEVAWREPDGFLYRLRQGDYAPDGVDQILNALAPIELGDDAAMPRRFVSLTWWMPTFMEWQVERVSESGGDVESLRRDIVRVRNRLDEILGVP